MYVIKNKKDTLFGCSESLKLEFLVFFGSGLITQACEFKDFENFFHKLLLFVVIVVKVTILI